MIKYSYNWLKEFLPRLPKPEKLAEILGRHSFEAAEIQKIGDDYIFSLEILPNRTPDAAGHWGLAKEIGSILGGKKIKELFVKLKEDNKKIKGALTLEVQNKSNINSYYLRMIEGIKITSSPGWLKKRLKLFGINSINSAVDLANLAMLELGEPLHIFDYDKIEGHKIILRNARADEKFVSLDGKKYILSPEMLVIGDEKDALALAGIKGGKKAETSKKTRNIVIEAGNFSHSLISKTSKKLGLITDASQRFSQRISPYFAPLAVERLSYLILKYCGGKVLKGRLCYDAPAQSAPIYFNLAKVSKILGAEISQKEIIKILKNVYCNVSNFKSGIIKVLPPSYRSDLQIEEDLIEEIARIYGYEKIKPFHPRGELGFKPLNQDLFFADKTRDAAVAAGFSEILSYAFIGEKEIRFLDKEIFHKIIDVQNPFRPEFRYLRPYLTPSLLNSFEESLKSAEEAYLFEMADAFVLNAKAKDTPELTRQNFVFGLILSEKEKKEPFLELKKRLNSVFEALGLPDVFYSDKLSLGFELTKDLKGLFHPFKLAQIESRGVPIGVIGEIHPEVKKWFGLKGKIAVAEFAFDEFLKQLEAEKEYRPISKYPAVMRDLAVLTPKNAKTIDVADIIENAGGELLVDSDLFDIYEGEGISPDKKSLAFRLVFQSETKTLTDNEVNRIMDKIIKTLEANPDFEVRR